MAKAGEIRFTDISLVSFSDDQIRQVAEHAGVTEERVREYLKGDEQDNDLFHAVHYITGCYPVGKLPQ